jgi:hypothetical protein
MNKEIKKKLSKKLGLTEEQAEQLEYRQTGQTTALAFGYMRSAILNPGMDVDLLDHHPTQQAKLRLLESCQWIVSELGLVGFIFNKSRSTMRFDLGELREVKYGVRF